MLFEQQSHTNYEVSHHQNRGNGEILVIRIGAFSTLKAAQRAAENALGSVRKYYISRKWSGHWCDRIDLQYRGLITRSTDSGQDVALSEIRIYAFEVIPKSAQGQVHSHSRSLDADPGHRHNSGLNEPNHRDYHSPATQTYSPVVDFSKTCPSYEDRRAATPPSPQLIVSSRRPSHSRTAGSFSQTRPIFPNRPVLYDIPIDWTQPQTDNDLRPTNSFSQTRSIHLERPSYFVPRPTVQYDEIMNLPTPRTQSLPCARTDSPEPQEETRSGVRKRRTDQLASDHEPQMEQDHEVKGEWQGSSPGGVSEDWEIYHGRRHSIIDLHTSNIFGEY